MSTDSKACTSGKVLKMDKSFAFGIVYIIWFSSLLIMGVPGEYYTQKRHVRSKLNTNVLLRSGYAILVTIGKLES